MNSKTGLNVFFVIIAILSGRALVTKYHAGVFSFEDFWSSLVYIIYILGFVCSICGLILSLRGQPKKT